MAKKRSKTPPPPAEPLPPEDEDDFEDEDDEDGDPDDEQDESDADDSMTPVRFHAALSRLHEEDEGDPILYLEDHHDGPQAILGMTLPDLSQCQCEWPDTTTQTFGPKPTIRCSETPTVIAFQKRVHGDHDPTGAMSLCPDHRVLLDHLYPHQCYYRRITSDHTIGDFA